MLQSDRFFEYSRVTPFFIPKQFLAQLKFYVDAIKIVADGTVHQEMLSVDNADSTLQIVKEQQPILADQELVNLNEHGYSLRFTN